MGGIGDGGGTPSNASSRYHCGTGVMGGSNIRHRGQPRDEIRVNNETIKIYTQ